MLKTRHLLIIFLPALILAAFVLFIRLIQYEPLYPEVEEPSNVESLSIIPIFPEDPILGNKKAGQTVILFTDLGCEHCQQEAQLIDELLQKHPDKVKVVWKLLPVVRFPRSTALAHEYAFCASRQNKFKNFADLAFANLDNLTPEILQLIAKEVELNQEKLAKCLQSAEPKLYQQKTEQLAWGLGLQAVPAVFLNNKQIPAPQLLEEWEALINF